MILKNLDKIAEAAQTPIKYLREIEAVLKLSRDEVRQRALEMLNNQLAYARKNSPFYANLFRQGSWPEKVHSLAELSELPFTTKDDLRNGYPFGFLAVPMSKVIRYGESTGTTGSPTSSFMTREDWEKNTPWVSLSLMNFFNEDDIVLIAVPYELAFAGFDVDRAFWNIGSAVVAVGTMNSVCPWSRVVEIMNTIKPSSIACSPSRVLRLYDMCREKGYDPLALHLKKSLYLGETCAPAKLNKIKNLWNLDVLNSAYGATETNTLAHSCQYDRLHLAEDRFCFELVDPVTGNPISGEERGELIVTTTDRQAFPLIRYRTGDIVRVDNQPCECGNPFRIIEHLGRYGERIVLENRDVLKIDLEECILSVPGTGCYYTYRLNDGEFQLQVEVTDSNKKSVIDEVKAKLFGEFNLDAKIEELDKTLLYQVMDNSLKPGSIPMDMLFRKNR